MVQPISCETEGSIAMAMIVVPAVWLCTIVYTGALDDLPTIEIDAEISPGQELGSPLLYTVVSSLDAFDSQVPYMPAAVFSNGWVIQMESRAGKHRRYFIFRLPEDEFAALKASIARFASSAKSYDIYPNAAYSQYMVKLPNGKAAIFYRSGKVDFSDESKLSEAEKGLAIALRKASISTRKASRTECRIGKNAWAKLLSYRTP